MRGVRPKGWRVSAWQSFPRKAGAGVRCLLPILVALCGPASYAFAQGETLDAIREDVRTSSPDAPAAPPRERSPSGDGDDSDAWGTDWLSDEAWSSLGKIALVGVAAPFWAPKMALDDDYVARGFFPRFPYDGQPGYLQIEPPADTPHRNWAMRLDAEYLDSFDDIRSVGGNLLLSTTWRVGLDASFAQLQESLGDGDRDRLWLGDCNFVFRFAQSPRAEFRTGLGLNWLDDAQQTDLGFNFTYAADFFPRRPWVVTSAIDLGTLGHAGLFRFRGTAGLTVHGVEVYTGYQYLDIGRTQSNALIAGLRVWF